MKIRRAIKMAKKGTITRKGSSLIARKETSRTIKKLGGSYGYADAAWRYGG